MSKLNKVLIISGPTATGKTALAVKLAKKYRGELISADSRQIYLGLDIGVGKDHPAGTPIHLIDLITPDKRFSVAQFQALALAKIQQIHDRGGLPIVVGCSGLYVNSLISRYSTFKVPPQPFLRFWLNRLPLSWLQGLLKIFSPKTFSSLNRSDVRNPYRLIRKIELALTGAKSHLSPQKFDLLHLSLTAPNSFLYPRIDARVGQRIKLGHLQELVSLTSRYPWTAPGLKVSAYHCLRPYLEGQLSLDAAQELWKHAEHHDAKHQKTYFKSIKNRHPLDISRPGWEKTALSLVDKWYNQL